jgi:hypothetical protein
MKGSLWLYEVPLPLRYHDSQGANNGFPSTVTQEYATFVIQDREGNHLRVKRERKEFFGSLEIVLAHDPE